MSKYKENKVVEILAFKKTQLTNIEFQMVREFT